MAKVNFKRLIDVEKLISNVQKAVDDRTAGIIANRVKELMLSQIAKGLSPLLGRGRFPEYKGAAKKAASKKSIAEQLSGPDQRKARAKLKKSMVGYPYDVQKEYPSKKPRPVNLYLSGDFLQSLKVIGRSGALTLGFTTALSRDKEAGHRFGANGQGERPILPKFGDKLNVTISREIIKIMQQAVSAYIKAGNK